MTRDEFMQAVLGDSLRRDDTRRSPTEAFDDLDNPELQHALQRAARSSGCRAVTLPQEMGEGWIMVPTDDGPRQVAYKGMRAWRL